MIHYAHKKELPIDGSPSKLLIKMTAKNPDLAVILFLSQKGLQTLLETLNPGQTGAPQNYHHTANVFQTCG